MFKKLSSSFLIVSACIFSSCTPTVKQEIAILPTPVSLTEQSGSFVLKDGMKIGVSDQSLFPAAGYLQENGVIFAPGKAANAGGVATSALEMSQNSERLSWTFEEVDAKLKNIMVNICHNMVDAAKRYDMEGNYVAGANIAGFEKVVDAMTAQGIV